MTWTRPWMAVTAAFLGMLASAPLASAQTQAFSSSTPLSLVQAAPADPYPGTIDVAGMAGNLTDVNVSVTLPTLSATQLDLLLVSPHGDAVLLSSDVPSTLTSQTWTFDDAAEGAQPMDAVTGVFKPTDFDLVALDSDTLPEPAPAEYGLSLAGLNGFSPNGQWQLFAADSTDAVLHPSLGSVSSWSLQLTTDAVPTPGIAIDQSAIDFGAVPMGTPASKVVTITNTGTAPLTVELPLFFSPDFTVLNVQSPDLPCSVSLPPASSCKFKVDFSPVTPGVKAATMTLVDNAPGGPHSIALAGTAVEPIVENAQQQPIETGSPAIDFKSASFSGPTTVGRPTTLHVEASDDKQPVTGLLVNFGEQLGLYGASACVEGQKQGGTTTFDVPYIFTVPGAHTITVTVFAGGCGRAQARTSTFTITVDPSRAARRVAQAAATVAGPDITSKCKNARMAPNPAKTKLIVKALVCVLNEQRKLYKLKPLTTSKKLGKAALAHTRAMIGAKFFAHQGPKEAALPARLRKAKYRGAAGENLAAGASLLATPVAIVNGWMHSDTHRANVLYKRWKTVGIGFLAQFPLATSAKPVATFTADFGVKK